MSDSDNYEESKETIGSDLGRVVRVDVLSSEAFSASREVGLGLWGG